ncbi:MAG: efflux RND transporter periplasmic adaptor subunit, partial [Pseudomonadota bacterium]
PLKSARITATCDCEGETVEKGRLIFQLDDSEIRAHLAEIQARLDLARTERDRAVDLLARGVGSQRAADAALAEVAEFEAARAAQTEVLGHYVGRAPLSGQVLRLDGNVGEVANPGEPLAWVGTPFPRRVVADVNEEDVPRIAVGQKALLKADAFPDEALQATVSSVTPKGDPVLKTYRVRLSLPDDTPLFIGMSVEVNIVLREAHETPIIPLAALVQDAEATGGGVGVWVVEDSRLRFERVRVGLKSAEEAQLLEGPTPGALVVSPAQEGLSEGAWARVREGAAP